MSALRSLYDSNISVQKKNEPDRDDRKKQMVVHIETAEEDRKALARGLSRIYGHTSTFFPLGTRIHLVSKFRRVSGNVGNMVKHTRLRVRCATFKSTTQGILNNGIILLDYRPKDESKTLHEHIIKIQSTNKDIPGTLPHARTGLESNVYLFLHQIQRRYSKNNCKQDNLVSSVFSFV